MPLDGDRLSNDLAALKIDREERPPSTLLPRILMWVAALGGLAALGVFVVIPYVSSRVLKVEVRVTQVALVSPAHADIELVSSGYVVAQTTAKVGAKVVGRVATLAVKDGSVVQAGDLIAKLDDTTQKSAVATAKARSAAARARVSTARATLAETRQQAAREKVLADKGVSPRATYEDLAARERSLTETVRAAEAEVASADADAAAVAVALDDLTISSPIHGTVIDKHVEVGELVGPQNGALVDLADFDSLVVELDVPEGKLAQVKLGTPCEIVLDAFPDQRRRGFTKEIGSKVDRAKGTVKVKVAFRDAPADGEQPLPDMSARVSFLAHELDAEAMKEKPKVVMPASAVLERAGAQVVFVVDQDKVHLRTVVLGDRLGDGFVVKDGPGAGTHVVASPPADLRDGQNIKEKKD